MLKLFFSSFFVITVGVGCAFLTHLLLARMLEADQYGIFSFISSLSLLISVFALFGFQNSIVRLINQPETGVAALVKFARIFTILGGIIAGGIVFAALYFLNLASEYPLESFILGVILTPLMVIARLHAAILRGFEKSSLSVFYESTLREVLFLVLIGGAIVLGITLDLGFHVLFLLALTLCISSIISWLHTRHHMRNYETSHDSLPTRREWLSVSFPMMLTIFAQRFMRRSDIIMLGLMVNPALVGAYAIAAQFSDVSSIGQKGIFAIFSPRAAKLYADDKVENIKALFRKMQLIGVVSTGFLCIVIAFAAPYILSFFGEAYGVGYTALLILLVGQFINVSFGPVGILMIMTAHEKIAMKFTIFAAFGNLILNPIAIWFYGLEGAAFVTANLLVWRGFASYIFVKREGLV